MDRIELLNNINAGRANLEAALSRFTPEQMTSPDLPGEWSVKDLLAHLGWWQRRAVMIYDALKDGVRPENELVSATIDELNARILADYRAHDLDEVRAFEHEAYLDLLSIAEEAPEEDLFGHHTFAWTGGQPFVDWIAGETYEHYAEHLPAVETLLAEQAPVLRPVAESAAVEEPAAEPALPAENPVVARARAFLESEGRFIDQARMDYHFGTSRLTELTEALGRFMTEDGGFKGLEIDIQAPQSNPFADELALLIFRWADTLPGGVAPAVAELAQPSPAAELEGEQEDEFEGEFEGELGAAESEAGQEPAAQPGTEPAAQPETEPAVEPAGGPEAGPLEEPAQEHPVIEPPKGGAIAVSPENIVRGNPLFQVLVAHLEAAQQEDGTWRFPANINHSQMAPWYQDWKWPSLDPSLSIAGMLKQIGVGSDTLHARVQALFDEFSNPADLTGSDFYAVHPYAYYFQTEWDLPEAEFYRQGVVWWLVRKLATDPNFDATHFFEFAPTPDSAIAKRLPPAVIAQQLDRLVAEQQPDGGWPTPYDERWRPWNTVNNLLVLRAYGRI